MSVWGAIILNVGAAYAQTLSPALVINGDFETMEFQGHLDFLKDDDVKLTFDDVTQASANWQAFTAIVPNFGFSTASYWFRTRITNAGAKPTHVLFEVAYPSLNELDIYEVSESGEKKTYVLGNLIPFAQRPVNSRNYVVDIALAPAETKVVYLRAHTAGSMQLPLRLWQPDAFSRSDQRFVLGQGFYFGMILSLAVYNFFVFLIMRDASYFYYALSGIAFGLFQVTLHGLSFQYLWPDWPVFNKYAMPVLANLFGFGASMFAVHFLQLRDGPKKYYWPLLASGRFLFVVLLLIPVLKYHNALRIVSATAILASLFAIFIGFRLWQQGSQQARYFLIAWISLLLGLALFGLNKFGVLPHNMLTEYGVQVGHALDVILLSMALADRFNILRKEKIALLNQSNETERKAALVLQMANEKLLQALKLSEQERQSKDQFMMAVSHELRTPLNAINSTLLQLSDVKTEEEKLALQRFIYVGAERLSTQVENVVMLVESGFAEIKPQKRLFFIDSILRRAKQAAESWLFQKPVTLSIERVEGDFAAYQGDEYLLFRFLMPVLVNACKYTEKGGVTCRVELSETAVDFCVSDTGPGIAPEQQETIFERFTQLSTGFQRTHEGLGIGLAVCQRIGQILGATITLESALGKGTAIRLHVPMQAVPDMQAPTIDTLTGHALVVEDNPINAMVLTALLQHLGVTSDVAENGEIALDKVKDGAFDIVLMDLQMPVMDGFRSAEIMRKRDMLCPIVAVTANSDYHTRLRCIEVGMNDFIAKPVDPGLIAEKLHYWLNNKLMLQA